MSKAKSGSGTGSTIDPIKGQEAGEGAYKGFGGEWRQSTLTVTEAKRATDWVEARIDKRSMLTQKDRVEDIRDAMWQLEKDGEILVHRIDDRHEPVIARTEAA